MKKQTFASVWDAIEDSSEQAVNMKIRSKLMSTLCEEVKRRKLSQAEVAKVLGVTQPRVSDLMRGRIDLFSIDALVNMHNMLGLPVTVTTRNEPLVQLQNTSDNADPKTSGKSRIVGGSPLQRGLLSRDPDLFLKPLSDAFFAYTKTQSIPESNAFFFYGAKDAAMARLMELDRIISEFGKLSKQPRDMQRMFEENRLLYGFYTNAVSVIESFCFGAYFLGTTLKTLKQEPEWKIDPKKTVSCFSKLDLNSSFTKALQTCIYSERYAITNAARNALSHRFTPFRTIRPMVDIHSWNLDFWFEGKLSKKVISLESKSLVEVRDWSDQQLDLLGSELESWANSHGLLR